MLSFALILFYHLCECNYRRRVISDYFSNDSMEYEYRTYSNSMNISIEIEFSKQLN